MSRKYTAVALDLDGTTLNDQHEVTSRTKKVLQELSKKGVIVGVASGRTTASVIKYIKEFEIEQSVIPVVAFNGAYGCLVNKYSNYSVTTVYSNPLSESSIRKLIALAEELGLLLQYYNGETGDVYAVPLNDKHKELLKRYATLTSREQVMLSSYEDAIALCLSPKAMILTENQDELIKIAKQRFPDNEFHIIKGSPHNYFVEFLSPGVNKSAALESVMKECNTTLLDIVAFGDGDNDKEMLFACALGVAPSNARKLAKNHANVILELSNQEDAVAIYLEKMLQDNLF